MGKCECRVVIITVTDHETQPEMALIGSNVNEYGRCIDRIR